MRVVALLVLAACVEPSDPIEPQVTSHVEVIDYPLPVRRALDVLVVIDNSPRMAPHLPALARSYPDLIRVLETRPGGLPDLHLGVITTDIGAANVAGCTPDGDGAQLRGGDFLVARRDDDGTYQQNFSGSLADAFTRRASVGAQGCAYTRPLEAVRRALAPGRNPGFVRDDADLAIAIITANDDCSFGRETFPIGSPAVNAQECPGRDSELIDVTDYVAAVKAVKAAPAEVLVSLIAGTLEPYALRAGPAGIEVAPSCSFEGADALPPTRLEAFLDAFPNRSTFTTLCQRSVADAFAWYAGFDDPPPPSPCVGSELVDRDPATPVLEPECTMEYLFPSGERRAIPACGADASTPVPCWRVRPDAQTCPAAPQLRHEVLSGTDRPPAGTRLVGNCLAQ